MRFLCFYKSIMLLNHKLGLLLIVLFCSLPFCAAEQGKLVQTTLASSANATVETVALDHYVKLDEINKRLEMLKGRKEKMDKRIKIAGLSPVVLSSLKQSRRSLDNYLRGKILNSEEDKIQIELEILDLEDKLDQEEMFSQLG